MFSVTIKFDRESLAAITKLVALGDRILDFFEAKRQAEIDVLTAKVSDALGRFRSSQNALQGALTNQPK